MRVHDVVLHCLRMCPLVTVEIVARYEWGTREHIQQCLDRLVRTGEIRRWQSARFGRNSPACYFLNEAKQDGTSGKDGAHGVYLNSVPIKIHRKIRKRRR